MIILLPAYERDYTNQKEAIEDWESGKDFIICDVSSPWDGKPTNILQASPGERFRIRYAQKRKSVGVTRFTADEVEYRLRHRELNRDQLSTIRSWIKANPDKTLELLLGRVKCTQS